MSLLVVLFSPPSAVVSNCSSSGALGSSGAAVVVEVLAKMREVALAADVVGISRESTAIVIQNMLHPSHLCRDRFMVPA